MHNMTHRYQTVATKIVQHTEILLTAPYSIYKMFIINIVRLPRYKGLPTLSAASHRARRRHRALLMGVISIGMRSMGVDANDPKVVIDPVLSAAAIFDVVSNKKTGKS